jgi:hypothetical protein
MHPPAIIVVDPAALPALLERTADHPGGEEQGEDSREPDDPPGRVVEDESEVPELDGPIIGRGENGKRGGFTHERRHLAAGGDEAGQRQRGQ